METNMYTRKVTADIIDKISKKLSFTLREMFLLSVKSGFNDLPLTTLVTGTWTVAQQFNIIQTALQDLRTNPDIANSKETIPWEELTTLLLKTLEKVLLDQSSPKDRTTCLTESTPVNTKAVTPQLQKLKIAETGEATSGSTSSGKPAKASSRRSPILTDSDTIKRIQSVVHQRINEGVPLYSVRAQKYVKCDKVDCEFCKSMYQNMDLTACSVFGHTNCNSVGYFPHVGISMWKTLRRQHDSGQPFKPKVIIKREIGDLPRLSEAAHLSLSKLPGLSSSAKRPRTQEDDIIPCGDRKSVV